MNKKFKKVEEKYVHTPEKTVISEKTYPIDTEIDEDQMESLKESLGMTENEVIEMMEDEFYESLHALLDNS